MSIECGITTCRHNVPMNQKYGECKCEENIILKFRIAADLGKGTIVMLECLNMELPQDAA